MNDLLKKLNMMNDFREYKIGDEVEINPPTVGTVIMILDIPGYAFPHYVIETPTAIEPVLNVRSGHFLEMKMHVPPPPAPPKPDVVWPEGWIKFNTTDKIPTTPVIVGNADGTNFAVATYDEKSENWTDLSDNFGYGLEFDVERYFKISFPYYRLEEV